MRLIRLTLAVVVFLFSASSPAQPVTGATRLEIHQAALQDPFDDTAFERYLKLLGTVNQPPGIRLYVVEGDLLLTRDEVRAHLISLKNSGKDDKGSNLATGELISNVVDGKRDYWEKQEQRKLLYSVTRSTFDSDAEYQLVVDHLKQAARDWEQACAECNIKFSQVSEGGPKKPLFDVVKVATGGKFAAASFYPSTPVARRHLFVDPIYFSGNADKIGVLRHELGHILGYRHEHVIGVAGCEPDPVGDAWTPLTPYDAHSVMHYFCGNAGTLDMKLTAVDIQGHRKQYLGSAEKKAAAPQHRHAELVMRLEGGEAAHNLALAAGELLAQSLLESKSYQVKAKDSICTIFKNSLGYPKRLRCPEPQFIALLKQLNPHIASDKLALGQVIMVPDSMGIKPYNYSRVYYGWDADAQPRLRDDQKLWNVTEFSRSSDGKKSVLTFEGYEVRIKMAEDAPPLHFSDALTSSVNVYLNVVQPRSSAPVLYSSTSPEDRVMQCHQSEKAPAVEGDYLTMLRNPTAGAVALPACAMGCAEGRCAQIHFVDTRVYPNPDILPAIKNYAGPAGDGDEAADLRLCLEIPFKASEHHATHLAGIMISQPNGYGFLGLSPGAQLFTYERDGLSDEKFADLISEAMDRTDRPQRKLFLFASMFEAYPDGAVDAASGSLKDANFRFRSQTAKRIRELSPLWITAAGQADEMSAAQVPVELTPRTPMSPMNLGDQANVVVVTSCTDCSDHNAKLDDAANYSQGYHMVHLAAPGSNVPGWATTTRMAQPKGGTSQAAAFVAGLAASMLNCHGDYFPDAASVRQRLMLTSRAVLDQDDAKKLRAGIVDAEAALLDPSRSWLKKYGDADYVEIRPKNWCETVIGLSDAFSKETMSDGFFELKQVQAIARYARGADQEPSRWVFTSPEGAADIRRSSPGTWSPGARLLQLADGSRISLNQIQHLLLAKKVGAGECK
ncbi:S8 family serine peptidase [Duganella sp. CY15W]|uniref:S8 family serine peptidase n=1 Tax=Duganella sp. CY15W TaxID=2692172 RepID=UPI00136B673B|nr:S8 family serine peptidase [Duganella sp. CY15W]MYM28349.1 S8 family serine peptidase [Duganella sp. CY15W]